MQQIEENSRPFSFSKTLKLMGDRFPLLFILFLFLLGGILSGALYTQNKIMSGGDLGVLSREAGSSTKILQGQLLDLPTAISGQISAAIKAVLPKGSQSSSAESAKTPPTPADLASPLPSGVEPLTAISAPNKADHYRGNLDAKVVLIEYGDFECPFCAQFEPTIDQLTQEYGDKIGRVFRHFPLSNHPHAEQAAEASECVAKQAGNDGFWKFNDVLFAENTAGGSLTPETIKKAAQEAGVNITDWQSCLDGGEMASVVRANQNEGLRAGFAGTPSTVMIVKGGQKFLLSGAVAHDDAKKFIDGYL